MTRKPLDSGNLIEDAGPYLLIFVAVLVSIMTVVAGVSYYSPTLPSPGPEVATPPYPWIVLNGGDGGTEEFNSWKIRVFYFVEQSYLVNPAFTDSLFKALGLTYQMSDTTFIGTAPVIQQNTPAPNVQ